MESGSIRPCNFDVAVSLERVQPQLLLSRLKNTTIRKFDEIIKSGVGKLEFGVKISTYSMLHANCLDLLFGFNGVAAIERNPTLQAGDTTEVRNVISSSVRQHPSEVSLDSR